MLKQVQPVQEGNHPLSSGESDNGAILSRLVSIEKKLDFLINLLKKKQGLSPSDKDEFSTTIDEFGNEHIVEPPWAG